MILIWEISQHTHIRLSTEASTPIIIIVFSSPRWHGWNVIRVLHSRAWSVLPLSGLRPEQGLLAVGPKAIHGAREKIIHKRRHTKEEL